MKDTLNNKSLVIGASSALVAIIAVFGYLKYSETQRFYMVPGKDGVAYKIDRKTGKTWYMRGGKLQEVEEPPQPSATLELPSYTASELTGKGGYRYGSLFAGDIYNPTDYHIDSITFVVYNKEEGEKKWEREFTDAVVIAPKSTGSFQFDTIDGDEAKATNFAILKATGRKKN